MPPRSLTWAIVAFWLATSGWLIYREPGLRLEPGEPTLFEMDLTDEARIDPANSARSPIGRIRWTLTRNDHPAGRLDTGIRYNTPEDPYELYGYQLRITPSGPLTGENYAVQIDSTYHLDWQGRCHAFAAEIIPNRALPGLRNAPLTRLEGWLRDSHCGIRWQHRADDASRVETVAASDRGNVLNLLQPLNRMPGLSAGQRWHMPVVDLLAGLTEGGTPTLRRVEAQVEEGTLQRQRRAVHCWIVTYHSEGVLRGRTWVRTLDALVLQQEMRVAVNLGFLQTGDRLVLSRDMDY